MKKNKIIFLVLFSFFSICFVYHDYFLYKSPILKIESLKEEIDLENDKVHQTINGIIKNGKYKNLKITVDNTSSKSFVLDEKITKYSDLFINIDKSMNVSITGIKRDKYVVLVFVIFIDLIIMFAGKKGLKTVLSLFVNILISIVALYLLLNKKLNINMIGLYLIVSILFIVGSLLISNGFNKKSYAAILSSIISLFISFFLSYILVLIYKDNLPLWTMEYIEVVDEYINFFLVTILLSGLGAIMDVAITISSSLNEIIKKNPSIDSRSLKKSGLEISKDIVGTMSGVMFFTCYSSVIPLMVLALKNNISLQNAIFLYGQLELIIVLASCISITMAIPITLFISTRLLRRKDEI